MPNTEIIDKLFLELSQFVGASTEMELTLQKEKDELQAENARLKEGLETVDVYLHTLNEEDLNTRFRKIHSIVEQALKG